MGLKLSTAGSPASHAAASGGVTGCATPKRELELQHQREQYEREQHQREQTIRDALLLLERTLHNEDVAASTMESSHRNLCQLLVFLLFAGLTASLTLATVMNCFPEGGSCEEAMIAQVVGFTVEVVLTVAVLELYSDKSQGPPLPGIKFVRIAWLLVAFLGMLMNLFGVLTVHLGNLRGNVQGICALLALQMCMISTIILIVVAWQTQVRAVYTIRRALAQDIRSHINAIEHSGSLTAVTVVST